MKQFKEYDSLMEYEKLRAHLLVYNKRTRIGHEWSVHEQLELRTHNIQKKVKQVMLWESMGLFVIIKETDHSSKDGEFSNRIITIQLTKEGVELMTLAEL